MVQSQYKLYYFDTRGAAEPVRLLLNYVKQPFEDVRLDYYNEWPAQKSKFFYGKLPVLEIDGKQQLAQSAAILRYFGEKFGLAGKAEFERAKINELIDFQKDVAAALGPYIYVKRGFREGDVDQLRKDVFLPNAETNLGLYEKKLNQSGSGFLLRSGLTMVDFMVAEYMDTLRKDEPEFMAKYPEVVKYIDRVNSLPQLKEYIAKRKN